MRPVIRRGVFACVLWLAALPTAAQEPLHKIQMTPANTLGILTWTLLASDPKGDGLQARLPDAKELYYAIDPSADVVWFKMICYEPLPERWMGITVAFDSDDKPDNGTPWWGTNKIKFDRYAHAFFSRTDANQGWQGYTGVADYEAVAKGVMNNLAREVGVALDPELRAVFIGVPRASLGTAPAVRLIATVGSMIANNDDVPNEGMVTIKLKP